MVVKRTFSSNDGKDCEWIHSKHMDIWNDEQPMGVLNGGYIPTNYSLSESGMIKKKSFPLPLTS